VRNPAQPSALIAALFDNRVVGTELRAEVDAQYLEPNEAAFCRGFAPKRIADFAAGRLCARLALETLGLTGFVIGVNSDRSPCWPAGVVGSISHTHGYACAVAAFETGVLGLGIDAEIVGRVEPQLDRLIFTPPESEYLARLQPTERARAATVIFSAKEAFYKCQYPRTRRWLDFTDASLELSTVDARSGTFVVHTAYDVLALGADVRTPVRGRFAIADEIAITAAALDQADTSSSMNPDDPAIAAAASSRRTR
jgi:4'-phosphopantetheinyl transferase EntD